LTQKLIEISGRVIHGQKYGRALGFPTANLDRRSYSRRRLKIRLGVWAGEARIQNTEYRIHNYSAAIVIGPVDKNHLPKLEAHLIGFKGDLYGKKIVITLGKYIRPFIKFKDEAELKRQIKTDVQKIKKLG
jgi:riboflavin kinase/FMN adenylyltransferase